jgi:hypothetical protein
MSDNEYIEKTLVYRTIKQVPEIRDSSTILNSFFSNCEGNSLQVFCDVESNLAKGEYEEAETALSSINPDKEIESNYKEYYRIFIKSKTEDLSSTDSSSLIDLAGMCPYIDGSIVYQARALYNSFFNSYHTYSDECLEDGGARIGKNGNLESKIEVILKTQLYPNPNDGNFVIRFQKILGKQSVEIKIINNIGQIEFLETKQIDLNNELSLKPNLLNGTYFIKLKLEDGTNDIHRLIINK